MKVNTIYSPRYFTIIADCPGMFIFITPPHMQLSVLESFNTGCPASCTVGEPGDHGEIGAGIQGIGVRTPIAAAVAAATVGLAIDWHIAKGSILTRGLLSRIVATGIVDVHLFWGKTIRIEVV